VCVYSIRQVPPDKMFVKATNFLFPNLCTVTGYKDGYTIHWHVPIDDTAHWKYYVRFNRRTPYGPEANAGALGESTPDYRLVRQASNRYLQDRAEMDTTTYAGLGPNNNVHDTWVTESQGEVQDRTQEHLSYNERGIVAARKVMLQAIHDVQDGKEPPHLVHDPARNHFEHAA